MGANYQNRILNMPSKSTLQADQKNIFFTLLKESVEKCVSNNIEYLLDGRLPPRRGEQNLSGYLEYLKKNEHIIQFENGEFFKELSSKFLKKHSGDEGSMARLKIAWAPGILVDFLKILNDNIELKFREKDDPDYKAIKALASLEVFNELSLLTEAPDAKKRVGFDLHDSHVSFDREDAPAVVGDAATKKRAAKATRTVGGLDAFNVVGDRSLLTYQNVDYLLSTAFQKAGKSKHEVDQMFSDGALDICPIGEDVDGSLRDTILKFIGKEPRQDKLSIPLIGGGRFNPEARQIEGGSHWTALHLRRNKDGSISTYYMDSLNGDVPDAVARVLDGMNESLSIDDLPEGDIYDRANHMLQDGITFNEARPIICQQQRDGYSCGYHAVFNLARIHDVEDPASLSRDGVLNQGTAAPLSAEGFISARKADLMREFPSRAALPAKKPVAAASKASSSTTPKTPEPSKTESALENKIIDIVFGEKPHLQKLEELMAIEDKLSKEKKVQELSALAIEKWYRVLVGDCLAQSRFEAVKDGGKKLSLEAESFLNLLSSAQACNNPKEIIEVLRAIIDNPEKLLDESFIQTQSESIELETDDLDEDREDVESVDSELDDEEMEEDLEYGADDEEKEKEEEEEEKLLEARERRVSRDVEFFGNEIDTVDSDLEEEDGQEMGVAHKLELEDGESYVVEDGEIFKLGDNGELLPIEDDEIVDVLDKIEEKMKSIAEEKAASQEGMLRYNDGEIIQASDGSIKFKVTTPPIRAAEGEDVKGVSTKWETLERDDKLWSLSEDGKEIKMDAKQEKNFKSDIMSYYFHGQSGDKVDAAKAKYGVTATVADANQIPSTTIKLITVKALMPKIVKQSGRE
jgi:hypothetical protein